MKTLEMFSKRAKGMFEPYSKEGTGWDTLDGYARESGHPGLKTHLMLKLSKFKDNISLTDPV